MNTQHRFSLKIEESVVRLRLQLIANEMVNTTDDVVLDRLKHELEVVKSDWQTLIYEASRTGQALYEESLR